MRELPAFYDERLLASWSHGEDAALWAIDDERVGILTVDFITPVVDDPRIFGEIAAANALSDVFAMGGRPLVALNIVCFPTSCEPIEVLGEILQGGAAKAAEAGAVIAGGHSVQDEEPKYGLVVFGEVERGKEWRTGGARAGDALILTKPLGTGIVATAIKAGLARAEHAAAAAASMATLNDPRSPAFGALREAVHACTDITGFALAGHTLDMLGDPEDGLHAVLDANALPLLPGIAEMAAMGMVPAGSYANREHYGGSVGIEIKDEGAERLASDIAFDPQTSGGLLLAVDGDAAASLLASLRGKFPATAVVGRIERAASRGRTITIV